MKPYSVDVNPTSRIEIVHSVPFIADSPLFIFAHGSGKGLDSPFIEAISSHLEALNINVMRFNFPFMVAGKSFPDRADILEESWRQAIRWASENLAYSHLFIGGKSMGARISTVVANEHDDLSGLIFLGYPLHPPGKFDDRRDVYLDEVRSPMLFIQGTRDPFARMDLLQETLSNLRDYVTLHWVEGGDHSFKVLVRAGKSYPDTLQEVSEKIRSWIDDVIKG